MATLKTQLTSKLGAFSSFVNLREREEEGGRIERDGEGERVRGRARKREKERKRKREKGVGGWGYEID